MAPPVTLATEIPGRGEGVLGSREMGKLSPKGHVGQDRNYIVEKGDGHVVVVIIINSFGSLPLKGNSGDILSPVWGLSVFSH